MGRAASTYSRISIQTKTAIPVDCSFAGGSRWRLPFRRCGLYCRVFRRVASCLMQAAGIRFLSLAILGIW